MKEKQRLILVIMPLAALGLGYRAGRCRLVPRERPPDPIGVTRRNITGVQNLCGNYRAVTGRYPTQRLWTRHLFLTLAGDHDLISPGFREIVDSFYDGWGRPLRYRNPGIINKDGIDIYSVGENGVDERGGGDDVGNWPMNLEHRMSNIGARE